VVTTNFTTVWVSTSQSGLEQHEKLPQEDNQIMGLEKLEPAHKSLHSNMEEPDEVAPAELIGESLFMFGPNSPVRKTCAKVVYSKGFRNIIIALILVNCVFMSFDDPLDVDPNSRRNKILSTAEPVFTALFTVEMILKVITMGFLFQKNSYLRDGWNLLDFFVVCLGYLSLIPGVSNLSSLRTFRVLRPLRTLSSIPG
jgi:hypothetical protein